MCALTRGGRVYIRLEPDPKMEIPVQSIPLVRVHGGTIGITGTVDVQVQNTPLEVEAYR